MSLYFESDVIDNVTQVVVVPKNRIVVVVEVSRHANYDRTIHNYLPTPMSRFNSHHSSIVVVSKRMHNAIGLSCAEKIE